MDQTESEVLLPQTHAELETFIESLCTDFDLPKGDETDYSVSEMIMHLPATVAYVKRSYFANGVKRGIAQKAAYARVETVRQRLIAKEKAEAEARKFEQESGAANEQPIQDA